MLRIALVVVSTLLSTTVAFASEKATVEVRGDYWGSYVADSRPTQTAGPFAWHPRALIRPPHWHPTNSTCYTMHTLVAEKKPESDETEIVKQRTCTPASQFEMKHTDQQAK
jgi:hypothetical protein